jgi:hypothetical protein
LRIRNALRASTGYPPGCGAPGGPPQVLAAAAYPGQSWRVSMNTGICREVLAWVSPS